MNWSAIPEGPEDPVYKVTRLYKECSLSQKVSLGVGAYRDDNGSPLVLEAVIKAKAKLAKLPSQSWTHEYQPISGHGPFLTAAQELLLGKDLRDELGGRVLSIQSLSGTGAIRLACDFFSRHAQAKSFYVPNPSWAFHRVIGNNAGLDVKQYRYIDSSTPQTPRLDFDGMIADLKSAPRGSIVVLHLCAHNPTGVDPTPHQWEKIAMLCKEQGLQPFFDNAYQGFASGDLDGDAQSVRMFVRLGLCPLVACSFAKNMGLYGERIGALHVVGPDALSAQAVLSQLKIIARGTYSNPPQFGAMVAHLVMTDPVLRDLWEDELASMSNRIKSMRMALRVNLNERIPGSNWEHITNQIGMFSYTGLTASQVKCCAEQGVFMLGTGRISMAGLNESNVDYVASVMANAIEICPSGEDKIQHFDVTDIHVLRDETEHQVDKIQKDKIYVEVSPVQKGFLSKMSMLKNQIGRIEQSQC